MKSNSIKPVFFIIGAGRSGAGLARYFIQQGFEIAMLVEKKRQRVRYLSTRFNWHFLSQRPSADRLAAADIVLLAVPDDLIAETAEQTAGLLSTWENKIVTHTSGALSSAVLQPFKQKSALIASVHPIYAFAENPKNNRQMKKIWFDLEGDVSAMDVFEQIFHSTGNPTIRVTSEQKKSIHLASVFSANFLIALTEISGELLEGILANHQAEQLLSPLLTASLGQISRHGTAGGLTGPIQRGDVQTIRTHLEYLQSNRPELLEIYISLSEKLLFVSGIPARKRSILQNTLTQFSSRSQN